MHPVVSLHKYYLWATYMAARFYDELPKVSQSQSWAEPEVLQGFMFLSYWYATLYAVAEGWKELRLADPTIDALLTESHLALLKRYRNGVFHFQHDYFDRRYQDFFDEGQAAREWVDDLHKAFTNFFTHWMNTYHLDGTLK